MSNLLDGYRQLEQMKLEPLTDAEKLKVFEIITRDMECQIGRHIHHFHDDVKKVTHIFFEKNFYFQLNYSVISSNPSGPQFYPGGSAPTTFHKEEWELILRYIVQYKLYKNIKPS